jgi:hypothetical protein
VVHHILEMYKSRALQVVDGGSTRESLNAALKSMALGGGSQVALVAPGAIALHDAPMHYGFESVLLIAQHWPHFSGEDPPSSLWPLTLLLPSPTSQLALNVYIATTIKSS